MSARTETLLCALCIAATLAVCVCARPAPVVVSQPQPAAMVVRIDGREYALIPVTVKAVVPGKSGEVVLEVRAEK